MGVAKTQPDVVNSCCELNWKKKIKRGKGRGKKEKRKRKEREGREKEERRGKRGREICVAHELQKHISLSISGQNPS